MEKTAAKFVWHYARIFKWFILLMIVLLVVGQVCRQFMPYYLSRLYDAVSTFFRFERLHLLKALRWLRKKGAYYKLYNIQTDGFLNYSSNS